jgi:hypothetical protein
MAMLTSQKLAVAAHLHVLLRRKTGRVTDTEWMAQNLEYAMEIIRYSRAKAAEDGHPDLAEWAGKLELEVVSQPPPARPLAATAMQLLRERSAAAAPQPSAAEPQRAPDSRFADSVLEPRRQATASTAPRYVGGIR